MPRKIPTFRPKWLATRPREARPSSTARGYGSAAWQRTRLLVIARDGGLCQMCGMIVREKAQIDHIHEKAAGGDDSLSNLRLLCLPCHSRRHGGPGGKVSG